ncbi:MAG: sulfotransferase domain-containing protein [Planctomycetota bacterium]
MLPDFFVIGAQKAGSTYLLECLGEHPEIFMPPAEVAFFEDPLYDPAWLDWFEQHFDPAQPGQVIGVKRPNLLGLPECPARLAEHMPELKLVVVLRSPVERAISAYFHYMKTGLLPLAPLEVGMPRIMRGDVSGYPRASEVLEFGLYARGLASYDEHFPADRILVTLLDDFRGDSGDALAEAYRFVGVSPDYRPQAISRRPMGASYSLTRLRLWNAVDRWCRRWTPDRRNFDRPKGLITTPLIKLNQVLDEYAWKKLLPAKRPQPSPALQSALVDYYRDDLEQLENRLGRDLAAWRDN